MIPLGILGTLSGGAAAGAYELISTTVLGAATTQIDFNTTGLGSTYKHLQLRLTLRKSTTTSTYLRLNDDTGTNYIDHRLVGTGSTVSSNTSGVSSDYLSIGPVASDANVFSAYIVDLLDFASTSKNKTTRTLQGLTGTTNEIRFTSGLWLNTAAITKISIANGQYVSGSRLSLYGVRG